MNGHSVIQNLPNITALAETDRKILKSLNDAYNNHQIYEFKSLLEKKKTAKPLLYNRREDEISLFEKILRTSSNGSSQFISLVWVVCELWGDSSFLKQVNVLGRLPIHYVIESQSQDNLFCFLVYDINVRYLKKAPTNNTYHLKLKNEQFIQHTGMSLFKKIYEIIDLGNVCKCLIIIEELLKEMKEIVDIQLETDIDTLLELKDGQIKEKILKILVKYWKISSTNYMDYRDYLVDLSPYFNLFLSLKENDEQRFEDSFSRYLQFMKSRDQKELHVDCNNLMLVSENYRKATSLLVNSQAIGDSGRNLNGDFSNFKLKLVQNGMFIGNHQRSKHFEANWIEPDVFEEYLDSCVTSNLDKNNERYIKIDYTFLVNPNVRDLFDCKSEVVDESFVFNKSMKPVEMIMNNEKLKHLISHPVISLYSHLMSYKYRNIYNLNLIAFLVIYVLPFLLVFFAFDITEIVCPMDSEDVKSYNKNITLPKQLGPRFFNGSDDAVTVIDQTFDAPTTSYENTPFSWLKEVNSYQIIAIIYLMSSTLYLTLREMIQMFWINETRLGYFKKKSNLLEMLLIVSSWWFLLMILMYANYYRMPAAFIILLASIEILIVLPTSSLSNYMFMLRKVSETFLKFFIIFAVIILAFTFSFYALFRPIQDTFQSTTSCHNDLHSNFEKPFDAFLKTTIMFAGNVEVNPFELDSFWAQFLLLCFVITSLVLLNLINGLAITDIQQLKLEAKFLITKKRITSCVDCEKVFCNLYWKLSGGASKVNEDLMYSINGAIYKKSFICRFCQWILMLFINRYPNLHKMDNLVVDCKLRTVDYVSKEKLQPVLKTYSEKFKSFKLSNWEFEKLNLILKERKSARFGMAEVVSKNIQDLNDRFDRIEKMLFQNMQTLEALLNKND